MYKWKCIFHLCQSTCHLKFDNCRKHYLYNYKVQVYLIRFDNKKGGPKEDQLYVQMNIF